ncbi:MAG: DUF1501 domain-containing protein [Planctomycetes bacterium]|nr:DUF1501 domain-containing protein [Planctomycetota bacterium]
MQRRHWLRRFGGAGLALLGEILRQRSASGRERLLPPGFRDQSRGFGRAKSVLVVVASGGQSQLETWDPRPEAPSQVRGEFGSIQTAVPGTRLCEHLPRLARLTDRYAIVKSMSHEDLDHGSALYLALTGYYHARRSSNPTPRETDHPFYGCVLEQQRPATTFLRSSVLINGPALVPWEPGPGQYAGLLGRQYDSLMIGDVTTDQPAVPGLEQLEELTPRRQSLRQRLLSELQPAGPFAAQSMADMNTLYEQAFRMLDRPAARRALDLGAESTSIRDRYGRHRPGQACLLGRRLVEAQVPLVTVIWNHSNRGQDKYPDDQEEYGWDTHNDIFDVMGRSLLPRFDQSFSALIEDLDQRGLLETTLVICMGEFGRAPLVALERNFAGVTPGRKHWAAAYSIVLAGAGVQGGTIVGAADRHAAYPITTKYGPWDVTATIFHALGIEPGGHFHDSANRPYLISTGQPIFPLYGSDG